jgi:hypothetical protein
LYKFEASDSTLTIITPADFRSDVVDVIDRSGMYDVEIEFNPSPSDKSTTKNGFIQRDGIEVPLIYTPETETQLKDWFIQVCSQVATETQLIPDTNFVRRHYYSNLLRSFVTSSQLNVMIPRLILLEIESSYNRGSSKKKNPDIPPYQTEKERRLAFHNMKEIFLMKRDGAKILADLQPDLIESFTHAAGGGFC